MSRDDLIETPIDIGGDKSLLQNQSGNTDTQQSDNIDKQQSVTNEEEDAVPIDEEPSRKEYCAGGGEIEFDQQLILLSPDVQPSSATVATTQNVGLEEMEGINSVEDEGTVKATPINEDGYNNSSMNSQTDSSESQTAVQVAGPRPSDSNTSSIPSTPEDQVLLRPSCPSSTNAENDDSQVDVNGGEGESHVVCNSNERSEHVSNEAVYTDDAVHEDSYTESIRRVYLESTAEGASATHSVNSVSETAHNQEQEGSFVAESFNMLDLITQDSFGDGISQSSKIASESWVTNFDETDSSMTGNTISLDKSVQSRKTASEGHDEVRNLSAPDCIQRTQTALDDKKSYSDCRANFELQPGLETCEDKPRQQTEFISEKEHYPSHQERTLSLRIKELERKLEESQATIVTVQQSGLCTINQLREELDRAQELFGKSRDELEELRSNLMDKSQSITELYEQLQDSQERNRSLDSELVNVANAQADSRAKLVEVMKSLQDCDQALQEEKKKTELLKRETKQTTDRYRKELKVLHEKETETYKEQIEAELQTLLGGKDSQIERAKHELKVSEQTVRAVRKELQTQVEETQALREQLQSREGHFEQLKYTQEHQKQELLQAHAKEIARYESELSGRQTMQHDLLGFESRMREDLARVEAEKSAYMEQCSALQQQVDSVQQELAELGGELNRTQHRVSELESYPQPHLTSQETEDLQQKLFQVTLKQGEAERQLAEATYMVGIHKKEIAMYRQEISAMKEDNTRLQNTVKNLESDTQASNVAVPPSKRAVETLSLSQVSCDTLL
eukprot:GHVQ01024092.1.p1 GENE.GHVQ01024092.1~~GHVQ01024092.1.p1  ORF type:complete len:795 (+),score=144.18 GHVQ01024092.1:226-2610(+)